MSIIYKLETTTSNKEEIFLSRAGNLAATYLEIKDKEGNNITNVILMDLLAELVGKGILGISLNTLIKDE